MPEDGTTNVAQGRRKAPKSKRAKNSSDVVDEEGKESTAGKERSPTPTLEDPSTWEYELYPKQII